jgi:hypothetical protein
MPAMLLRRIKPTTCPSPGSRAACALKAKKQTLI